MTFTTLNYCSKHVPTKYHPNKSDGNIVAFLMEMEYLDVEKPADYSADGTGSNYEQAGKDSTGLAAAVEDPESVKRPNIIVIMDEAFSDLAVRGEFTFRVKEIYLCFISFFG